MSIQYIRDTYKVPAKVGGRITFCGKPGKIIGASGPHLRIRMDGERYSMSYHPTYHIEYQEAESE